MSGLKAHTSRFRHPCLYFTTAAVWMLSLALRVMLCEATGPFAELSAGGLQDRIALCRVQTRVVTVQRETDKDL